MNEQNKMWWWVGGIVLLAVLAVGYGWWGGQKSSGPNDAGALTTEPPIGPSGGAWLTNTNPAVIKAGEHLMSEMKAGETAISLLSVTPAAWPDGCLGLPKEGEFCTQAIVPGYDIRFTARGVEFIYHTNNDGTILRLQTPFDVKG